MGRFIPIDNINRSALEIERFANGMSKDIERLNNACDELRRNLDRTYSGLGQDYRTVAALNRCDEMLNELNLINLDSNELIKYLLRTADLQEEAIWEMEKNLGL